MTIRKNLIVLACGLLVIAFVAAGCGFVDPTEVRNQQTTEENLKAGATGGTKPFLNGVVEAYANSVEDIAYFTDTVSDNFDNIATFISPEADKPRKIIPLDLTLNGGGGPYFEVQEFRALAQFVIDVVLPNDVEATNQQRAELLFYLGMSNLISAENFVGVPIIEGGAVINEGARLDLAISDFESSLAFSSDADFATRIHISLARAYRLKGNASRAAAEANLALAGGSTFLFNAQYDAANNTNAGYTFAVARSLFDIQPLPRLDYLDPKYTERESPIYTHKREEAFLILAEVELSNGNASAAAGYIGDAIDLAKIRSTVDFFDEDPRHAGNGPLTRPKGGTVKAGSSAPEVAGLIIDRRGNIVTVPTVSGTSLDAATVRAMTNADDLFATLYLARQEIFFFEGRRMSDLGLRLCMMAREIETNPNINEGDFGTVTVVPSWIPANDELDAYSVSGTVTTITHDMNRILAQNKNAVSPFPF